MRDLLADYERLAASGPVGRAVVTSVWGSAPRPPGATLLATADGRMAGSISGGCVEANTVEAIGESMRTGVPRHIRYAVSDERAWEVGLACGGTIEVFVEPMVRPEILQAAREEGDRVVISVIDGVQPSGAASEAVKAAADRPGRDALRLRESRLERVATPQGEVRVFLEVFVRRPTLLLIGAVHVAEALARLAAPLGYRVIVADARSALLTPERFPGTTQLILAWPEEVFSQVAVDDATAVCVLTHDPKFDDPAVRCALRSPAAYVGAIGSRRTHEARRERLRAEGYGDAELARLHGPIGLDLGGKEPAEVALAVLAEITAVRHGRPGRGGSA